MGDQGVSLQQTGSVLTVTLDRPDSHNALTPGMIARLTAVFQTLNQQEDVRVVVLTGNGRSFCAGADLTFMRAAAGYSDAENIADGRLIFDLMQAVDSCNKPVIGQVNGAAIGGGCGLVSCCDIVVTIERAKFAFSEVLLGIVPAVISPFILAKIGLTHGRALFLTGERFSADHARHIGLVHDVVADEAALEAQVAERVAQLLQGAPGAQTAVLEIIRTVANRPKESVRDYTASMIAQRRASAEGREGMSAFLEKRKPSWQSS